MSEARFSVPPSGGYWPHTWVVAADVIISLTQEGDISDELWQQFCADAVSPGVTCHLGVAVGNPSISSVQRRASVDALKNKQVTAVMNSNIARGVVTAVGWLGLDIKGFAWKEIDTGLGRVKSSKLSQPELKKLLEELLRRSKAPSINELIR